MGKEEEEEEEEIEIEMKMNLLYFSPKGQSSYWDW